MAWLAAGIGILIGTPIAGSLHGPDEDFLRVQVFGGAIMAGGFVFACVPWWYIHKKDRQDLKEKNDRPSA